MFRAIQNSLLSIIYPSECAVCSGPVEAMQHGNSCSGCWAETRIFTGSEMLCHRCGALLGEHAAQVPVSCLKCDHYHFESAIAIGVYEKALAASIIKLKKVPRLDHKLTVLIEQTIRTRLSGDIDLVIPVPLSKARRIERGFNQAEVIAGVAGRVLSLAVDNGSLARTTDTKAHRVVMDQKARELSVNKAFEVVRPNLVARKAILLVDDVLTSGATTSACSNALKRSGARKMIVFTLARAVVD